MKLNTLHTRSPSSVLGNINLIDLTNLSSNEVIKIEDKDF
jgi:hypothetical protein